MCLCELHDQPTFGASEVEHGPVLTERECIGDRRGRAGTDAGHRVQKLVQPIWIRVDGGKGVLLFITPKGTEAKQRARTIHHAWIKRNFADLLTDADLDKLTKVLEKLDTNIPTRRA